MSDRKLDLGNVMEQALRPSPTKVPHPLEHKVEQLEALLREAECPNAAVDFLVVGVKCVDGVLLSWNQPTKRCDFCKKRDELLAKGE